MLHFQGVKEETVIFGLQGVSSDTIGACRDFHQSTTVIGRDHCLTVGLLVSLSFSKGYPLGQQLKADKEYAVQDASEYATNP